MKKRKKLNKSSVITFIIWMLLPSILFIENPYFENTLRAWMVFTIFHFISYIGMIIIGFDDK